MFNVFFQCQSFRVDCKIEHESIDFQDQHQEVEVQAIEPDVYAMRASGKERRKGHRSHPDLPGVRDLEDYLNVYDPSKYDPANPAFIEAVPKHRVTAMQEELLQKQIAALEKAVATRDASENAPKASRSGHLREMTLTQRNIELLSMEAELSTEAALQTQAEVRDHYEQVLRELKAELLMLQAGDIEDAKADFGDLEELEIFEERKIPVLCKKISTDTVSTIASETDSSMSAPSPSSSSGDMQQSEPADACSEGPLEQPNGAADVFPEEQPTGHGTTD
jgi:hypothetical protein